MKKATLFLLGFMTLLTCVYGNVSHEVQPIQAELKSRLPEWRPRVYEQYQSGAPRLVIFYSENEKGEDLPVKRIHFHENGRPLEETDLTTVDEKSPAFKAWNSTTVPHGVSVRFRENGEIERVGYYDEGLLHGPLKVFFSEGRTQHITYYKAGVPHGKIISYYENGELLAEGNYVEGKLEGDYARYYETGEREALFRYANGVLDGKAIEWYESGKERANRLYKEGSLHSERSQPAVLIYTEDHSHQEIQDFKDGKPHGNHVKYHTNGRKSYVAHYEEGLIHGKEQLFDAEGNSIGEGEYVQGKKVGKHWKKHENGTTAFLALFDKKGALKEAVREFAENGQKIAEYSLDIEGKLHGNFLSWHENGEQKMICNYDHGEFDGKQQEFYENKQLRFEGFYVDKLREGLFREWHQDGTPSFEGTFAEGNKEGTFKDWHPNGKIKLEKNFKNALYHGVQSEWYENGQKRLAAHYVEGKKSDAHKMWSEAGTLLFEGSFDLDMPTGKHISYYPNKKTREVAHFLAGKKVGVHEIYYENGQLQHTETYKDDLLEGESKGFYPDGSAAFVRTFKKGNPVGTHKDFFALGTEGAKPHQIASLFHYDAEGKMDGQQQTFHPSGVTKTSISYDGGTLHGLKALWDAQGNVLEESKYIKGKLDGRHFQKDPEGREIVYHYKNNKREGSHSIFYPIDVAEGEKVKAIDASYKNNKLEGRANEFDPSGAQISFTTYKAGIKDGPAQLFHRNGKPALALTFKKDKREGLSEQFFPNGKLYKEVSFVNDLKEGEEKTFFEDGRLNSVYRFHKGELEGIAQHWNESEILIFEASYKKGQQHGKFLKFYDDGKPRLEQNYVDGKLDGLKKSWDSEGRLTEAHYKNGTKVK